MFDERDDGLRRARAVENVGAVERAAVGDAFEIFQGGVGFRFGEADFDARFVAGGLLQFERRAFADDFSVVDDGDAVAKALGFFDVVGGEDDGFLVALELFDDVVNFAADLWVEAGGGFVEENDFGIVDERDGESEALLLAAGKLGVESIAFFFEPETLDKFFRFAVALIKTGEEIERFLDAKFVGQGGGLKRGADFVFEGGGIGFGIAAADDGGAAVGVAKAFEDFDGAGFAGAVGAEKAKDFAFVDGEADAADGFDVAVAFEEVFHSNNGFGHKQELTSLQQRRRLRLPLACLDLAAHR